MESGNQSDDDSIMPPLLSEEEMDAMDSCHESDDEPMYTDMLEDISDSSQYHPNDNRRGARYKYVIVFKKDNQNGKER